MKERGILFTPENHRLIMSGTKVQTRRVMNPQWTCDNPDSYTVEMALRHCRHGKIGDRLYVKEGVIVWDGVKKLVGYYMDGCRPTMRGHKRLTAMFMAKQYARTWLEITDVRVEKLQDISEEDAKAEGVNSDSGLECSDCDWLGWEESPGVKRVGPDEDWTFPCPKCGAPTAHHPLDEQNRMEYRKLWDSINGKSHPWSQNSFVWAISFKVVKP
jgi:hypothetical protein